MYSGRPLLKVLPDRLRQSGGKVIPLHYGKAVRETAGIRHCGAGGDNVEAVSHHVREDQGDQGGWVGGPGQPAAFAAGKMLAEAVDLTDIRPALQEKPGGQLFLRQIQRRHRGGEQGAGPAGKDPDYQVFSATPLEETEHLRRSQKAGLVGNGMTCFNNLRPVQGNCVAVLHDDQAGGEAILEKLL